MAAAFVSEAKVVTLAHHYLSGTGFKSQVRGNF